MSTEYDINYDDQRFKDVEADKKAALSENEKLYSGMIQDSDGYYQAQVDATKQWEKQQTQLQQQKTDFAIEQIEQQKDQAKKDYTREQSGAYADWQKQSNEYGANAEQEAAMGMSNTGYSESAQVGMYNAYQQRVMAARESYNTIILNYNNAIQEARLQGNSLLAEIAYNSLQKQLELNLQGFQYKNQLLLDKAQQKVELEQIYHERWQDVLGQINTENAFAEERRQFNAQLAEEQRQFNYKNKLGEFAVKSSGGSSGRKSSSKKSYSSSKKSSGSSAKIKKSSSSSGKSSSSNTTGLPKATADSILRYGGPQSPDEVDRKVKAGLLKETTNKKGELVFRPTLTNSLLYSKRRF